MKAVTFHGRRDVRVDVVRCETESGFGVRARVGESAGKQMHRRGAYARLGIAGIEFGGAQVLGSRGLSVVGPHGQLA